jgi:hypothetical protein
VLEPGTRAAALGSRNADGRWLARAGAARGECPRRTPRALDGHRWRAKARDRSRAGDSALGESASRLAAPREQGRVERQSVLDARAERGPGCPRGLGARHLHACAAASGGHLTCSTRLAGVRASWRRAACRASHRAAPRLAQVAGVRARGGRTARSSDSSPLPRRSGTPVLDQKALAERRMSPTARAVGQVPNRIILPRPPPRDEATSSELKRAAEAKVARRGGAAPPAPEQTPWTEGLGCLQSLGCLGGSRSPPSGTRAVGESTTAKPSYAPL